MDIKRVRSWHSSSLHGFPCISSFLLFLLTQFWVFFTTSMANLASAADGENPEKSTSAFSCIYCRKSFANHHSLGGHLRSHNVQLKSAWRRNCPGSSSTSIGFASTIANPLSSNQPGNSCEGVGNNIAFHNRSSSNLTLPMNASKFFDYSRKSSRTQNVSKSFLWHSFSELNLSNCYSSTAFAGSGSTPSTGVPLDVSLTLGLNGVQKLSNDEIRTCQHGKPFFYGSVLQNSQPNLSKHSFSSSAITIHIGCLV